MHIGANCHWAPDTTSVLVVLLMHMGVNRDAESPTSDRAMSRNACDVIRIWLYSKKNSMSGRMRSLLRFTLQPPDFIW